IRQSLAKFSESEASNHTPSLAGFTTSTPELKFSVHTGSNCAPMHNDWNCHSPAPVSHWHGPGKIPHVPPTLESRGCSLLELRCWSLTMTGLRLALRV